MDAVQRSIQAVKDSQSRNQKEREWELRCDEIRKRELFTNWEAVRKAIMGGVRSLQAEFPDSGIGANEIPSRQLEIHKSVFPALHITVGITLDGATITINKRWHQSANQMPEEAADGVCVEVSGNSTHYEYGDNPIAVDEVAAIVLQPILDTL